VPGNRLRILCDARENYPAWEAAVEGARRTIHLDMYIVHNDPIGRRLRDLLVARARAGVAVRLLYDWFGSLRVSSWGFWRPLRDAGVEVRVANPPALDRFLGLLSRDHRKLLTVDGAVAFVSGLCIGQAWMGDPARGVPPWRDTGVEITGPAVADAEAAFARTWGLWGPPLPPEALPPREGIRPAGPVALRVVATSPEETALYRTELLVAGWVRERLWVTDAYFLPTATYVEALRAAARDGVDVRLLVPSKSDVQWIANVSRARYRPLLESGVRVFEWNGSMIHAKTAVADGTWTRIGSSNLNPSSWIGNWELDVAIEDEFIAWEMERLFLEDLRQATEVVIDPRERVRRRDPGRRAAPRGGGVSGRGSANRVMADVATMRTMLDAAVKGHRSIGRAEAYSILVLATLFVAVGLLVAAIPRLLAYPVALLLGWTALTLLVRGWRLRRSRATSPPDA
jgi:phosphatidylserine/phosphatidylglycerophosphate/cardiolipin synthase-like enzyme